MSNTFPGFQAAQDILGIYLNSLRNQGEVWNAAFGKMMSGSYQCQDLVRDFAKSYQLQHEAATLVLSYRPNSSLAEEGPVWLHFYIEAARAKLGDFTLNGKTRPYIGPNLDATWVVSEGPPSSVPFKLEASCIDRSNVRLQLRPPQGLATEEALRALCAQHA